MTITYNESRLWTVRWGILMLLAAASVNAYLTRHSLAVVNTTIQSELGIKNEEFGWLYAAFSLGYMIFQIPGGWIGQRYGVRFILPMMACLWSLATFATACMTTFSGLLIMRLSYGVAQAGLVPCQAVAVRDWMDRSGRGVASSVMVVAMSVGSVASMLLTPILLGQFEWRTILIAYSTTGIAWAILFGLLYRSSPKTVSWLHEQHNAADSNDESAPSAPEPSPAPEVSQASKLPPLRELAAKPTLWGLAIQAILKAAGYNLAVTFLPALLEYIHRVPSKDSGTLVTSSLVAFITGSTLGGIVVDRVYRMTGSKFASRSLVAAVTLMLAALFTSMAGYSDTAEGTAIWLSAGSLFSGLASTSPWVAVMDIGGRSTAIIMGFMNSFSALGGVLLSPLAGRVIDTIKTSGGRWEHVFQLHGAYYLVAGLSWLLVDPNHSLETTEPHDTETHDAV